MSTAIKVGRNDPCPCGSGMKYKSCCARKRTGPTQVQWLVIGALVLLAVLVIGSRFKAIRKGDQTPNCPAGQVWSPEHGHCH